MKFEINNSSYVCSYVHNHSLYTYSIAYLATHICICNPIYKLDAETKVTKRFRNPRARGCSIPSKVRALLRAHGFLNRLVTIGHRVL